MSISPSTVAPQPGRSSEGGSTEVSDDASATDREDALREAFADEVDSHLELGAESLRQDLKRKLFNAVREPVTIGRYRVDERIGEGGMGVVYRAHDPRLGREVAIKLMRPRSSKGAESSVQSRMLREAQALARISHPNVVAVHDAGDYRGQVYVAMDFIDGTDLKAWRLKQLPGWREAVQVFVQAGRGLAAAHAVGLIHRDFKPGNVLIGVDGRVQVIDFGLVKLGDGESTTGSWGGELLDTGDSEGSGPTGSRTAWSDELTRNGAVVGTVAYMAPEQITGEAVDARADQFSFCVALYEAIYRVRPFSGANREQLVMRVLEGKVDPAPANARVPSWLRRICLRGLSPIPGRRFASMDELLAALERGLARRRRVGYLAAAAASVLLAGVGSFFHGQTSAPPDACAQARAEMGSIWDADTRASVQNALLSSREPYAAATWQTVDRTIAGLDRARARTLDLTCEERTGAGLSREQLTRRILCVAETDRAISGVLSQLADRTMDLSVAVDAVADLPDPGRCLDDALLTRLESETALEGATILKDNLARQLAEAERVAQVGEYRRGLELAVAATRAAESLGDPELRARAWQLRGQLEDHTGDPEAAARSFDRSQQLAANVGAHVTWTRAVAGKLWALGEGQGELTDAVWWSKELAAAHEHLAHAGLAEAELLASTGDLLESRGDQNEALAAYRKALALHERAYGPDHPQVALSLSDLGVALYRLDRLDEARATLERARAILEASVGPEHPQVATALSNLALVLQAQGDLEEAAKLHARALTIEERTRGPGHPALAISHHNLGYLAFARGDYQGSIEHYTRALEIFEQGGSRDHLRIASTENALGISLKRLGRGDEALPHYRRALELRARQLPEDSVLLASTRHNLGRLLLEQGEPREAAALLEQALTVREEALAAEDTQLAKTRRSLGIALVEAGELERARPVLERALVVDRANVASELEQPLALAETRFALARALDDPDRAVRLARLADEAHASAGASTSSPERRAIAAFLQRAANKPSR